ncbi:MAG: signal recognition particle protein [Planctomycetes bacterium GWC2_39_26]|nr:MAG: signal recognition particle protein [Planctomycetes bacterium GWC2_39_26]
MFESITNSLEGVFSKLRGKGRLTESNIKDGLHEVRLALLEADVNYKVVKDFIQHVTERAVGEEVIKSIAPGQQVIKIVHDELIKLMGESDTAIPFMEGDQTLIMLVGLQGSGKTTTAGKLAKTILSKGRKPLLVAADVQRPAAIEQLKVLGQQLNIPVYFEENSQPVKICKNAVKYARESTNDVVIFDTAGRLHIDDDLMFELKEIKQKLEPHQIYFVCDAMTGQDAVNSAKEFDAQLGFDGVILTKLDGDTRGGAALSIRAVTGKPIKFVGIGEKLDRLEEFHPDRMASRILGMGDVVSLVEKAQQAIDLEEAQKLSKKIQDDSIGLDDFLAQLQQIKKMGPIKDILSMIPGVGSKVDGLNVDEKQLQRLEAIIRSMTTDERLNPDIINGSRRQRVANGSGTTLQDVNQLLKQFKSMKKLMKHFKGSPKSLKKMGQLSNSLPFAKDMMR